MPTFSNSPDARPKQSARDALFNGGTVRETMPRWSTLLSVLTAQTSGTEYCYAVDCYAGDVLTAISFVCRTQPVAGTGTPAGYYCLRDSTGALLAYTADTSGSWTGWTGATELNVAITKADGGGTITSYVIPTDAVYYLGCMAYLGSSGGTTLALGGNTYSAARHSTGYASTSQKKLACSAGTSLTSAVPPSTATFSTGLATHPYAFVH